MQKVESLDFVKSEDEDSYYNSIITYDDNLDSMHLDLQEQLKNLNDDEKKLIYARYYDGYTQSELSREETVMGKPTGFLEYERKDGPVTVPKERIKNFTKTKG